MGVNMLCSSMFLSWMLLFSVESADVRVEVTTPINPVNVADILAVQCQVWNIQHEYKVSIARIVDGTSEQITSDKVIMPSTLSERVFLSIRPFSGGSRVYFLTMLNVSPSDRGEYGCTVSRLSGLSYVQIGQNSASVQVNQFPDKAQPRCTSNPDTTILKEGSRFELTCTTYKTIPVADLRWRLKSSYQYLKSSNTSQGGNIFSRFIGIATIAYQGAVFECELSSRGFPDRKQFCQVGPITITKSNDDVGPGSNLITISPGIPPVLTTETSNILLSPDCDKQCQSSSFTVLILTISTMGTCILTIVFLVTTIVMCCKYHTISSEVNSEPRHEYVSNRASDPVYVSLQRRRDNEQVYMTLEDPNNPEGKVLLPKEVFESFYNRTLSLRKS